MDTNKALVPLEDIKPPTLSEQATREEIEGALRVCKVRRDIMERMCAANEYRARIFRHEATLLECEAQLQETDLLPWQQKDLEGRLWGARAAIDSARQQIMQGGIEIQVLQMTLRSAERDI